MNFWKYQGAGNDFVLLDQRHTTHLHHHDTAAIAWLCDRRFGIGGDGLMLLQAHPEYDFEMVYFNADGREGSMCGNGGRCIAAFARHLGIVGAQCRFLATDGPHEALLRDTLPQRAAWVELKMNDLGGLRAAPSGDFVLNTGSPHYVRFTDRLDQHDLVAEGRAVRYAPPFESAGGINVNLIERDGQHGLRIRTYERGVEDETLACGTGVTAAALAAHVAAGDLAGRFETPVQARGGALSVRFAAQGGGRFTDIWLCGPAERVFAGEVELPAQLPPHSTATP